jgi:outer membrane protein TolC
MKRPCRVPRWLAVYGVLMALTGVVPPGRAFAQGGALPATDPASLPLSGRSPQGPTILGSTPATGATPLSGPLSLRDAIERGLEYNLSGVGLAHALRLAQGQQVVARSALRPSIVGDVRSTEQKVNLAANGVQFDIPVPGFSLPDTVGPYNVFDLRARLTQSVLNLTALNNYRAARESVRASELTARDARDAVVLAVGGAYLQAVAARARLQTARAQIETATTLHRRADQQRSAGLATPVDVNRAQVQLLTQQQRLVSMQADFAKQKINLARMIGLRPTDQYDLADDVAFSPGPVLPVEDALKQAAERRSDLKAAEAQVAAAERALAAAQAERLPSVVVAADYGTNRTGGTPLRQTFSFLAAVRIPIWEGGRVDGQIQQAQAVLDQRRAEIEDLKSAIEGDVRKAYVDLQAAASQLDVAQTNLRVSNEILGLTRQRFDAGVGDNVSVVQSQELVAAAELDRVNSVFAHNLAKLDLARAMGRAAADLTQFLNLP